MTEALGVNKIVESLLMTIPGMTDILAVAEDLDVAEQEVAEEVVGGKIVMDVMTDIAEEYLSKEHNIVDSA